MAKYEETSLVMTRLKCVNTYDRIMDKLNFSEAEKSQLLIVNNCMRAALIYIESNDALSVQPAQAISYIDDKIGGGAQILEACQLDTLSLLLGIWNGEELKDNIKCECYSRVNDGLEILIHLQFLTLENPDVYYYLNVNYMLLDEILFSPFKGNISESEFMERLNANE